MSNNLEYIKTPIGLEVIILLDGSAYVTQSSYARFVEITQQGIAKRCKSLEVIEVEDIYNQKLTTTKVVLNIKTRLLHENGKTSDVVLIPAKTFGKWLIKDKPDLADAMLEAGSTQFLYKLSGYEVKAIAVNSIPQPKVDTPTLKEQTDYAKMIQWFQESGDIQLAQLLKVNLGNVVLAATQQQLPGDRPVVEQFEGAVEVAIRLGFTVPKRFEGSLGAFVKKYCEHLCVGKNSRYSAASGIQVDSRMYPKYNKEVEQAVTEYCLSKAFTQNIMDYLD